MEDYCDYYKVDYTTNYFHPCSLLRFSACLLLRERGTRNGASSRNDFRLTIREKLFTPHKA